MRSVKDQVMDEKQISFSESAIRYIHRPQQCGWIQEFEAIQNET